jgi:hypothetical protein
MPSILKRFYLRVRSVSLRAPKKNVVSGARIERRIEVNKIDRFIRDVLSQDVQVIAEVKGVHL